MGAKLFACGKCRRAFYYPEENVARATCDECDGQALTELEDWESLDCDKTMKKMSPELQINLSP